MPADEAKGTAPSFWVDETPWSNATLHPEAPDNFGVYHDDPEEGALCVRTFCTQVEAHAHADQLNAGGVR